MPKRLLNRLLQRRMRPAWVLASIIAVPSLVAPAAETAPPRSAADAGAASKPAASPADGRPLRVACPYPQVWDHRQARIDMRRQGWNGKDDYAALMGKLSAINSKCRAGDAASCFQTERQKLTRQLIEMHSHVQTADQLDRAFPSSKYRY